MEPLFRTLAEKVDPKHTALVVVDVQNDFCAGGGFFDNAGWDLSMIQAMAPRLDSFIPQAREAGVTTVFVQAIYDQPYLSPAWIEKRTKRSSRKGLCLSGTWGADFYVVKPQPEDVVVTKHRFSAFVGSNLDLVLRSKGIRTVLATGVATNVCVESTARDACQLDYSVVLLEDCCATNNEQAHIATLQNVERYFGEVRSSEEVAAAWQGVLAAR